MARFAAALLVCSALGFTISYGVRAGLYGYVDEQGRAHVSDRPLDERYKLFAKGELNAPEGAKKAEARQRNKSTTAKAVTLVDAMPVEKLPKINKAERRKYAGMIKRAALRYRLEPALLHAVISAESAYDPYAVSPKGASGLMQLMPETAEQYGVANIYDPQENIAAGAKHLRYLLRVFDNDVALAVAAYNAGHNNVIKYGRAIPPFAETRNYVPRVLGYYRKYQAEI